jgi:hypothetical protein
MHDLDRSMFEVGELEDRELGPTGETQELEQEAFLGVLGSLLGKEAGELYEAGSAAELQEVELATELLEVGSEAELEQFLGNLIRRAAGAARDFVRSPAGQALGGILKQATKRALPAIGRGVGSLVSPGGGEAGARVGRAAGSMLGLELEGLSGEDREFEVARGLVRFAGAASRNAAAAPAGVPPAAVARQAALMAARDHAPGLIAALGRPAGPAGAQSGRWQRQGHSIVIFDA